MSSATLTAAASASAPWLESLATARGSASRRTPVILQTEAAECGLACLAMVASHHGHRTDLASLRRRFELSMKGATLAHLIAFGQSLGLAARPLRLDLEHLPELALPAVLHWDMNHFVVLVAVRRGEVVIHDPARGRRVLRLAEFSKHFTGIALELTPGDGFERKAAPARPGLRALMGRVGGLGRAATQVLLLAIALEVFTLVSPFFLQWVVDGALVARDGDLLTVLVLGFGALVLVREAVSTARAWAMTVLSTQLNVQWLGNVFRHLLRLPVGWFEKRHLGDVVSRFESVHTLQRTLTHGFFEAVLDGVMAVVTLAMMFIYSAKLALVVLAATALYVLVRLALHRALYQATEEHIVAQAKERSHFLETVRGITSIKLFNAQADRVGRYMNLVVEATNRQVATQKLALGARFGHGVLWGVTGIVVVWLGAKAVLESAFSVGMLFAFVAYKDQFLQRVGGLIEKVFEWRMLGVQSDRLADIVTSEPEAAGEGGVIGVASARTEAASVAAPPSIEVRDLHFRYAATEAPVLAGVNLRIESGEAVAIVGASGSGKSTLGKVMLGLLPAGQGQVLIDGVPVDRLGLRRFREMVGTVMQEDQLFAGSIADNIAFFDPNPDQAWIIECARLAAIHDEIEAMPMRYDTLIGDMGAALSGGQKQRILLARALYKRPRILFLDEATSALDVANERLVNEAVRRLRLTRVIIAHRPETIAMADRVIVLAGGRVQQNLRAIDGTRPTDNHDNERNSA